MVGGDQDVAGQRHFKSATHGDPVDRPDDRLFQVPELNDPGKTAVEFVGGIGRLGRVLHCRHFLQVPASAEDAFARAVHDPDPKFRVVDKTAQIFGGRGTMCENPVERLTRAIHLERIWESTSEIQKVVIGSQLKKRGLDLYAGWD